MVPSCVCRLIDEATALKTQPSGVLNSTVKSFMGVEAVALVDWHRQALRGPETHHAEADQ